MTAFAHPLPFGAALQPDGTTFRIWAPSAETMRLRIGDHDAPMHALQGGWHEATARAPAGTPYGFVMPDGLFVPDPASRLQETDVHGPSLVTDPSGYAWRNPAWQGRPWNEAVVYECHVGLMGGFRGLEARLPELQALGITAIELMPLADVPGPRNWGYDGVLPYAPDRCFGTPDELKSLIDTAHGLGLMMMLDVVYNHFGPDGAYLHAYAKPFFDEHRHTPWGAAIDFKRPEVRAFFLHNTLYWLNEFRFDGLRYDAVHAIAEEDFFLDLAREARAATAGRHIHLVLEHEDNAARLLRTLPHEPLFDAQWADDLHHCLHVLLTGETEGYYGDFTDATRLLARCLAEGFAYQGEMAPHLERPRGEPSGHLPTSAFVVCLQNHDQIGNRAMGDRLTTLADPGALRAATMLLLLSPFIPMLFMGEEHASRSPFQFFTSHGEELARLVRDGRRAEFAAFAAFQDEATRARIPDPNDPETYLRSRPERSDPTHPEWMAGLLRLRHAHVAPGIPGARSAGVEVLGEGAVQASWTLGTGRTLTIGLNLGKAAAAPSLHGETLAATPDATSIHLPPGACIVTLA